MNQQEYSAIRSEILAWVQALAHAGWLSREDVEPFAGLDDTSPGTLFDGSIHRPLVIGFFGGTGVGKSSLLNRLAGAAIARVGVERPTSREVSLYAHESVRLDRFPPDLPLDRIRLAHHHNDTLRRLVWIDMPDIDSAETANRELALRWIPHIDLLIYVVSPERYRDDCGWAMLMEQRGTHAWAFVMNQWDHGDPVQIQDFLALLKNSGFAEPYLFRTQCASDDGTPAAADDFASLERLIEELADKHLVDQIESQALACRTRRLQTCLAVVKARLEQRSAWDAQRGSWEAQWNEVATELKQGLAWVTQRAAEEFLAGRLKSLAPPESAADGDGPPVNAVWDPWAQQRWEDVLAGLTVDADDRKLPRLPLQQALAPLATGASATVGRRVEERLRCALSRPGNRLQRVLYRLCRIASLLLPLGAAGWVTFNVVTFYYRSSTEHLGYLGVDFAVHSALLIILAWLLPYLSYRALKPSAERAALRGIRAGLDAGLDEIGTGVSRSLEQLGRRSEQLAETASEWLKSCEIPGDDRIIGDSRIARLLPGR
ncbi:MULTISPECIES: GTPase [unclassified Methylococcus]|uniref:GTPase n=1 Tax=unclassified Methylococcus TaxID=2618889 RepID=UPI003D7C8345